MAVIEVENLTRRYSRTGAAVDRDRLLRRRDLVHDLRRDPRRARRLLEPGLLRLFMLRLFGFEGRRTASLETF
jgi:hypothetical protein